MKRMFRKIFRKKWFKAAGIRAIKTVAQTMLGYITVGSAANQIDWATAGSVALVAGIYSLITSVAGLPEVDNNTKGGE